MSCELLGRINSNGVSSRTWFEHILSQLTWTMIKDRSAEECSGLLTFFFNTGDEVHARHQRYLCSHCRKTWQLQFTYTASQPGTHQKIIDMAMNGVGCRASARIMGVGLNTVLRHLKNSGRSR